MGKNTTINVFENPAGETFHVAGCRKAHLKYYGQVNWILFQYILTFQPSLEATWFPGMKVGYKLSVACNSPRFSGQSVYVPIAASISDGESLVARNK